MNRQKALINISVSVLLKIVLLTISLFSRRFLLSSLGSEAVGLYSIYVSVIGFLAIAELGIGSAITFTMYKPIVEKEIDKVSALYYLYKKIYNILSIIVFLIGLVALPFIPYLAKDYTGNYDIYFTYFLFLLATVITYIFAYKTSFINAHMDNYITVLIYSVGKIIEAVLQIFILIYWQSFTLFIMTTLISNFIQLIATEIIFKLNYSKLLNTNKFISHDSKEDLFKKVKAMFFHKIGTILVNTTDSLIISAFISVSVLGVYSIYVLIVTSMINVINLFFTSITSVIGHSYAKNDFDNFYKEFKFTYTLNCIIGIVFFLGFYAIIDNLIELIFTSDILISNTIVKVISINYFIQFMRSAVLSFRDASGTFYQDRYKPLIEGIVNLALSLIAVQYLGIFGVVLATIITNIFITHLVEPYVLFRYGLYQNVRKHYFINYLSIILFISTLYVYDLINFSGSDILIIDLIINGFTSVFISGIISILIWVIYTRKFTSKAIVEE